MRWKPLMQIVERAGEVATIFSRSDPGPTSIPRQGGEPERSSREPATAPLPTTAAASSHGSHRTLDLRLLGSFIAIDEPGCQTPSEKPGAGDARARPIEL
jgi:hypothetical protein